MLCVPLRLRVLCVVYAACEARGCVVVRAAVWSGVCVGVCVQSSRWMVVQACVWLCICVSMHIWCVKASGVCVRGGAWSCVWLCSCSVVWLRMHISASATLLCGSHSHVAGRLCGVACVPRVHALPHTTLKAARSSRGLWVRAETHLSVRAGGLSRRVVCILCGGVVAGLACNWFACRV